MERLTTDQPMGIMQNCLNLFYAKDGEAWVRDGAPGPLHKDVHLFDFIREAIRATVDEERTFVTDFSDEELGDVMVDYLEDGNTSVEGLIGTLYTAGWAFAEIRERLKAYEDTGLEPEEIEETMSGCAEVVIKNQFATKEIQDLGGIEHLRELVQAEKAGRLVVLPCKVGDTVYRVAKKGKYINNPKNTMYIKEIVIKPENVHKYINEVGRTVYLTREEAEAAMKGGDHETDSV